MKKRTKIFLIVLAIILVIAIVAVATVFAINWQPVNKVNLATLESNENVTILYKENSEIPTIISGKYTNFKVDSENDAIRALEEVQDVFGMTEPKEEYKISNEIEFLGNNTYRLQQVYKGLEVVGRQMSITTDEAGNIKMVSGDYEKIENLDVNPTIDQNTAINKITSKYGNDIQIDTSGLIIEFFDDSPTLCWLVLAYGNFEGLDDASYYFFVDAKDGEILKIESNVETSLATATGQGVNGQTLTFNTNKTWGKYEMYDPKRKIEIRNYTGRVGDKNIYFSEAITSNDNTWSDSTANQAMSNFSKIYDYFEKKFNIESMSGKNSKLTIVVNNASEPNNAAYMNSFGDLIVIGPGDGVTNKNFVEGLDVLAHEYMHGYVRNTDSWIYKTGFTLSEVNEAYADVMGNIIENYYRENAEVKPFSANENLTFENDELWLIGEDVVLDNEYGMRCMANPSLKNQPSAIDGENYLTTADTNDESEIIHNNATAFGHAVYKMWKGGVTTDEIAAILLESCNRLSRTAKYGEIANMIVALANEYCPDKVEVVTNAFVEMGLSRNDGENTTTSGTTNPSQEGSVLNQNLDDIYKKFVMNKEYDKDIKETFGTATYYAIKDINKDGVEELFIQDAGFGGFFNNLVYTYDKNKGEIIFIDSIYSYGMLEYSEKDSELVYSEFKPFSDAGASGFYKLENNKLVWSKTLGHNGPDYKGFFINTAQNGEQSISEEENKAYFENVDTLDYTKIIEMQLEEVGGISDLIEEARNEHVVDGEIQAGSYKLKYGIYRSSLQEYEMLGGIYVLREDGTYTYRNIWKNYEGEAKFVYATGTYEVKYFDDLDSNSGWGIEFTSTTSDETMANSVWLINGSNSFEAVQYPNKFTYIP